MKNFLLIILSFIYLGIVAQPDEDPQGIENVVPPSPEAASLGKYGEYPVSTYTGVPNISIPLYTISTSRLSVPISLSYHASGIKVEEVASNVGLGWSLNAGGVVTRAVKGLPDDASNGYYRAPVLIPETGNIDENVIKNIVQGNADGEPDIFYFNFSGYSGSFFFDDQQEIVLKSKEQVTIEILSTSSEFYGFIITTPDGNKFYFGEETYLGNSYHEETKNGTVGSHGERFENYSSWYLRKIESVFEEEEINFTYENFGTSEKFETTSEVLELSTEYLTTIFNGSTTSWTEHLFQRRIDLITFPRGSVDFIYNAAREDVENGKRLDRVDVKNTSNQTIKSFELGYSYFNSNVSNGIYSKRLKLNSVKEIGEGGVENPPYSFTYYTGYNLPPRKGNAQSGYYDQDHWGYYNGAGNIEGTLIPTYIYNGNTYYSSDREPSWPQAKANILEKIIYPTGGSTEFEFEPNYIGKEGSFTYTRYDYFRNQTISGGTRNCYPGPTTHEYEFTIHDAQNSYVSGGISLGYVTSGCEVNPDFQNNFRAKISMTLTNLNTSETYSFQAYYLDETDTDGSLAIGQNISPGPYRCKITMIHESNFNYSLTYKKYYEQSDVTVQKSLEQYGGMRIKKIKDIPGDGGQEVSREYEYMSMNDNRFSTGTIINRPNYMRLVTDDIVGTMNDYDYNKNVYQLCVFNVFINLAQWIATDVGSTMLPNIPLERLELTSMSRTPIGTTQGGIVGYVEVKEKSLGGYNIYRYSSPATKPDVESSYYYTGLDPQLNLITAECTEDHTGFPYPPIGNMDWARGHLTEKLVYDASGELQLKEVNTYSTPKTVYGAVKASSTHRPLDGNFSDYLNSYAIYYNVSGWNKLTSTTTTQYFLGNPKTSTRTYFSYNGNQHLQLTEKKFTSSQGDEIRTIYKYPRDYFGSTMPSSAPTSTIAEGIYYMVDNHIYNKPVEAIEKNGTEITGGQINLVKEFQAGSENVYPFESYKLDNNQPISSFTMSSLDGSYNFIKNSNYERKINFDGYNSGKLTQYHKENDIDVSIIWGYNNKYPVARIENINYSAIPTSAITNIQNHAFMGSDALVDIQADINYLKGQLSSLISNPNYNVYLYTYKPLFGKTSETDPSGKRVTYEYDEFGRLEVIKDNDGKILEHYDYHYKN